MGNRKEIIHKYRLLFNFLSSLHPLMSYPEVQFAFIQHFSASLIRSRRQAIISSLKYFLGNCWDHTGFYGSLALLEILHLNHPSWHWEEERRSSITARTANNRTPNVYIKSAHAGFSSRLWSHSSSARGPPVSALANALSCRSCRVFIFIPELLHTAPEGTWKPICSTGSVSIALRALN